MRLFIITGPPAAGKSTVSKKIAASLEKCALLEGDVIYHMVKNGIEHPWKSEKQVDLAFQNLADLSMNFLSGGFDVVLDWIVMPEQVGKIIEKISINDLRVYYIVLMAGLETLKIRDRKRDYPMETRIDDLHREFQRTGIVSHSIFTDNMEEGSVAMEILENLKKYEWRNGDCDQQGRSGDIW